MLFLQLYVLVFSTVTYRFFIVALSWHLVFTWFWFTANKPQVIVSVSSFIRPCLGAMTYPWRRRRLPIVVLFAIWNRSAPLEFAGADDTHWASGSDAVGDLGAGLYMLFRRKEAHVPKRCAVSRPAIRGPFKLNHTESQRFEDVGGCLFWLPIIRGCAGNIRCCPQWVYYAGTSRIDTLDASYYVQIVPLTVNWIEIEDG